jgi:hypothetical protein
VKQGKQQGNEAGLGWLLDDLIERVPSARQAWRF